LHDNENMFKLRRQEKLHPILVTSVHDTVRNEAAKKRREDLRIQAELDEKRKQETELDYLAPFLARSEIQHHLTGLILLHFFFNSLCRLNASLV